MYEVLFLAAIFVALIFIYWLANLAEKDRVKNETSSGPLAVVSYSIIFVIYLVMFVIGAVLQFVIFRAQNQSYVLNGIDGAPAEIEAFLTGVASAPLLAVGFWLPALLGMLLLLPPVRRLISKFTDINPASPVHAISLSLTMLILINLAATLGLGLENLTGTLEQAQEISGQEPDLIGTLWTQQILTALLGIVGVGWLSRRNWGETMARLGIVRPTGQQVLIGIGLGLIMIPVVAGLEALMRVMGFSANQDVEALTEQLLGGLFETPFGIITLGASAALGEETIFRGAAQPRFGLVLTSLLFAIVHSNYGLSFSTLIVFALGMVLGWVRLRHNTTTSMIMHGVYNSSLGLLVYLGTNFFEL